MVLINHFARTSQDDVPSYVYRGGDGGHYAPDRRLEVIASGVVDALSSDLFDRATSDLAICNASEYSKKNDNEGSFILLRRGQGFLSEPDVRLATTHAHGMVCADTQHLDHDGFLDLVFGGFGEPDLLFFHGGPDGFDAANPRRLRMELDGVFYDDPRFLCAADLTGDGWLDIVVPQIAADRSFILWGGPNDYSMDRCQLLSVFHAVAARAADLDGDGRLELIVAGHTQSEIGLDDAFLYIYWNGPAGLHEDRRTLLPASAVNSFSVYDLDNNGMLDIFVSSYATPRDRDLDSCIYWNRPGRGFSPDDRTRLFTHSASGSLAADLNGNGWTDLVVANHKVCGGPPRLLGYLVERTGRVRPPLCHAAADHGSTRYALGGAGQPARSGTGGEIHVAAAAAAQPVTGNRLDLGCRGACRHLGVWPRAGLDRARLPYGWLGGRLGPAAANGWRSTAGRGSSISPRSARCSARPLRACAVSCSATKTLARIRGLDWSVGVPGC